MSDEGENPPKKDLTGILELTSDPAAEASGTDASVSIQEAPIEEIEEFESIETLTQGQGAEPPIEAPAGAPAPASPTDNDPLAGISGIMSPPTDAFEVPPAFAPSAPPSADPIGEIKAYSESMPIGKPNVEAAFPFSLLIEGTLTADEREKLLDLLSAHQMGIREVDLEPQFESGKILIPRISEFAGVLLVQALRGAQVEMRLGPSDEVFASEATRSDSDEFQTAPAARLPSGATASDRALQAGSEHPAERIPLSLSSSLPGSAPHAVIDALFASAMVETTAIEAESSSEYQEILEALQRELKYKAHRKGATAILNFSIELTRLTLPSRYRLTVIGTAVREASALSPSRESITSGEAPI